jgi:hypothetical protein
MTAATTAARTRAPREVLARRRRDNQIKAEKIGREDQCAARHLYKQCRSTSSAAQFPLWVDIVAKVENRTTPKISRRSIFRRCCCRKALWGQYEGRWSFLYETTWSPMSPRAKRISDPKNFRSSPQKDFFNTIGQSRRFDDVRVMSAFPLIATE